MKKKVSSDSGSMLFVKKTMLSGVVCTFVASLLNPIDVVKVRMQMRGNLWPEKRFIPGIIKLVREEGWTGCTRGVQATIIREILYSSFRMGAYEPILHLFRSGDGHVAPAAKYAAGMFSGGIGSAMFNPTDLVKVNFQATLPSTQHLLPYKTTLGAFLYIYRSGGISALYKGWPVTSLRSAMLTSAQLGTYDSVKNNFLKGHLGLDEGYMVQFYASMLSSIVTTTVANPVDVVKTRYMSDKSQRYANIADCILSTYRDGGVRCFFRGWFPSYMRLGPHTVLAFLMIDQLRIFFDFDTI